MLNIESEISVGESKLQIDSRIIKQDLISSTKSSGKAGMESRIKIKSKNQRKSKQMEVKKLKQKIKQLQTTQIQTAHKLCQYTAILQDYIHKQDNKIKQARQLFVEFKKQIDVLDRDIKTVREFMSLVHQRKRKNNPTIKERSSSPLIKKSFSNKKIELFKKISSPINYNNTTNDIKRLTHIKKNSVQSFNRSQLSGRIQKVLRGTIKK